MGKRNVPVVYTGEADNDADGHLHWQVQLVFGSPQELFTDFHWCDILQSPAYHQNIVRLAVDEVHCVKKW